MARSLTVSTEEKPTTHWLLTGFLLLAVAFMAAGAVLGVAFADDNDADDAATAAP